LSKAIVQYLPEIELFLNKLSDVLFEKNYFSYLQYSENYVEDLTDFIEQNISNYTHKTTPKKLIKFGTYYFFYKANNRTTWYIFFEKLDHRFLITHITNNHIQDIRFLNDD
jgi:hypothetical protein